MKKIIGVVPSAFVGDADKSCMDDHYKLGNNYIKRVHEAGGIPIGLAPIDKWVTEDELNMCDAFLVQGGAEFYPYHFQVIHHAVIHGKKYLGICLGEQLIYVYFKLCEIVKKEGYEGDVVKAMCDYLAKQPSDFSLQKAIPGHRSERPRRGNEDAAKHDVNITEGTLLYRVVGRNSMRLCSFHNLNTPPDQTLVTINAWSAKGDGVVEGTEYGENILGVQGHPEADGLLPELFDFLVKD